MEEHQEPSNGRSKDLYPTDYILVNFIVGLVRLHEEYGIPLPTDEDTEDTVVGNGPSINLGKDQQNGGGGNCISPAGR